MWSRQRVKVFTQHLLRWLNDVPFFYACVYHHQIISNRLLILFWPKVLNFQVNQFYHLCVFECVCVYGIESASTAEKRTERKKKKRTNGTMKIEKRLWIGFIILRQIQCNLMRVNPIVFAFHSILLIFSALNYNIECLVSFCVLEIFSTVKIYRAQWCRHDELCAFVWCETYR